MLALAKKRGILFTLSGVIDDGFDPWKMDHVKRWRNFDGWFLSTHIFPLFIITIILLGSLEGVWWVWAFGYSMAGQSWSTNKGQKLPKFNFSLYWSTSFKKTHHTTTFVKCQGSLLVSKYNMEQKQHNTGTQQEMKDPILSPRRIPLFSFLPKTH